MAWANAHAAAVETIEMNDPTKPRLPAIRLLLDFGHGLKTALGHAIVQILLFLAFAQIAVATVFYRWAEKWPWLDALYFSVITISTVGYGDFSPKTTAGKLFTIGYILCGLGLFVTVTAILASQMLKVTRTEVEKRRDLPE